jgi:ABC-type spermidine/putrescine transport system permease subunit I
LRGIDPALAAAARGLGAGPWLVLARVVWPLSLPAVALCLQLGWVWGLGAFLGPLFLGGPGEATLAVEMHRELFDLGRWPRAAADGVALSLLCLTAFLAAPREARA